MSLGLFTERLGRRGQLIEFDLNLRSNKLILEVYMRFYEM